MCYIEEFTVVYPDGTTVPRTRVIPCVHGTGERPCINTRGRAGQTVYRAPTTPTLGPQMVEVAPAYAAQTTPPSLRNRRGRNDLRLEFEWHIPFTSRDGEQRQPRSADSGRGRLVPLPARQYVLGPRPQTMYEPHRYDGAWQGWQPRVVTVDPASIQTPPRTPSSSRRSRSIGSPIGGREHVRGHSGHRSDSRDRSRHSRDRYHDDRIRDIDDRIERLERDRDEARAARARDERINELTAQIRNLQRQRPVRREVRIVETHHQDGRNTQREAPRRDQRGGASGGAGGRDFLRNTGRRAIQRDIYREEEEQQQHRRRSRPGLGAAPGRARIAGPQADKEAHSLARVLGLDPRRSESRRRDRRTERLVYAGEGPRPHRWN